MIKIHKGSIFVIGPSGSGKSTFCDYISQFYSSINREHIIINLDPGNEQISYNCEIDIRELININEVMENLKLGPNGGLIYCMDFLAENKEWLFEKLQKNKEKIFIFDFPGQIELYINNDKVVNFISEISEIFGKGLIVQLFDSFFFYDKFKFISGCLYSMISRICFLVPTITLISKIDLVKKYGELDFPMESYLNCNIFENMSLIEQFEDSKNKINLTKKINQKNSSEKLDKKENKTYNFENKILKKNEFSNFTKKHKKIILSMIKVIEDYSKLIRTSIFLLL